jgi:hypothetical protein
VATVLVRTRAASRVIANDRYRDLRPSVRFIFN